MFKKFVTTIMLCGMFATAQANDKEPVKLVSGFAPGGPSDIIVREIQKILTEELGRSVILEYRAGAGSEIAVTSVAKNKTKETVLMMAYTALSINNLQKNSNYDLSNDLIYSSYIGHSPMVLVTTPQSAIKSLRDVTNWPSDKPLFMGTGGPGSGPQLCAEALGRAVKKQVVPVPYKGGAPALIDLMGNQHPLGCHLYSLVRSHIQDGRLIPLMVTSINRSAQFPEVPTASEVGLKELEGIQIWNGFIANTTADTAILKQVEDIMDRLVKDPVRSRNFSQTVDLELDPALTLGRGPAFKKFVLQDIKRYKTTN